jgi:hypothetical protein
VVNVTFTSFFHSYGAFVSASKYFNNERLLVTGGIRIDPNDPTSYQMRFIENTAGTILPSIGIIVEF